METICAPPLSSGHTDFGRRQTELFILFSKHKADIDQDGHGGRRRVPVRHAVAPASSTAGIQAGCRGGKGGGGGEAKSRADPFVPCPTLMHTNSDESAAAAQLATGVSAAMAAWVHAIAVNVRVQSLTEQISGSVWHRSVDCRR